MVLSKGIEFVRALEHNQSLLTVCSLGCFNPTSIRGCMHCNGNNMRRNKEKHGAQLFWFVTIYNILHLETIGMSDKTMDKAK